MLLWFPLLFPSRPKMGWVSYGFKNDNGFSHILSCHLFSSSLPALWVNGFFPQALPLSLIFEVIGFSVAFISLCYFLWLYCFRSLDIITR